MALSGFDVDTRDGGNRMYFVSETGVLTMLCAWALAAVLYIRVKKQIQHLSFGHIQVKYVSIHSPHSPVEYGM